MSVGFRRDDERGSGGVARASEGHTYIRTCTSCKGRKQVLGGSNKKNRFVCKECGEVKNEALKKIR